MSPDLVDVLIVGGGLSGLAVAQGLFAQGIGFTLLEARDRFGGRILSMQPDQSEGRFDLGPAWVWPHNQRILKFAQTHGLRLHPQFAKGCLVFEDASGTLRKDLEFAPMGDALRFQGGSDALIRSLVADLPVDHIHLDQAVTDITREYGHLSVKTASGTQHLARRVVLALPPRLWAQKITFAPRLPDHLTDALSALPTWMAGHAKIVVTYETAFWRDAGFSGDALSHLGPLAEIHDATDEATGDAALFGFVGVADREKLGARTVAQLVRLFGRDAAAPTAVLVKDWADDPMTAVPADRVLPGQHPLYRLPAGLNAWAGQEILFAGTESAPEDGGFLEGALEAAETVLAQLLRDLAT